MKRLYIIFATLFIYLISFCSCGSIEHVHEFGEWTVTKKATCSKEGMRERLCSCGEVQTQSIATIDHNFANATCTEAMKCTRCGTTSGSALGHSWNDATCNEARKCTRCGTTSGSALGHSWNDATCNEARKCTRCGTTSGSALGHSWNDATCNEAKECTRCGATFGSALGHSWNDATCTEARKCTRCGTTSGSALGHKYSNGTCYRCGEKDPDYSEKTYSLGETWIVDEQWEFTINSVTRHYLCNPVTNRSKGYTDEEVIIINYTYKNIGYTNKIQDLFVSSASFYVYDETGEVSRSYACIHCTFPKVCAVGTKCTAEEDYVLSNKSSSIMLIFSSYTSNGKGKVSAKFILNIS